jgi:hypothetical protein
MTTASIIDLPQHKQMMVLAFLLQVQASANIIDYSNAESDKTNTLNVKPGLLKSAVVLLKIDR